MIEHPILWKWKPFISSCFEGQICLLESWFVGIVHPWNLRCPESTVWILQTKGVFSPEWFWKSKQVRSRNFSKTCNHKVSAFLSAADYTCQLKIIKILFTSADYHCLTLLITKTWKKFVTCFLYSRKIFYAIQKCFLKKTI